MDPVSIFLLVVALVLLVGIGGEVIFQRTGIPDVLWLIGIGALLGPVLGLVERETLLASAPHIGALALVVVLFDGGSELRLEELGKSTGRSVTMAALGFALALGLTAPTLMIGKWLGVVPASWGWMHAIMIGGLVGGSSSVVVMPALRRARLRERFAKMVNLEIAVTDVFTVVVTGAILAIMAHRASGAASSPALVLAQSFVVGTVLGIIGGLLAAIALRRLGESDFAYPLLLGWLFLLHVGVEELGGSGALGILAAAVMVGNAPNLEKSSGMARAARVGKSFSGVHDPISFLIKSFFFAFVGAMLGPDWGSFAFGVAIGLLLLVARVAAAGLATLGTDTSRSMRLVLGFLAPRGMAAGALALLPLQAGVPDAAGLPPIVFAALTGSIATFAITFPLLERRLPKDARGAEPPSESDAGWTVSEALVVAKPSPLADLPRFEEEPPTAKRKRLSRGPDGLAKASGSDERPTRAPSGPSSDRAHAETERPPASPLAAAPPAAQVTESAPEPEEET